MKSYLKHKILNLIEIKELTAVEYPDFDGKYKDYLDKHDFWELCFVEKGEIKLTVEDESQILVENTLVLIPPDKTHSYCYINDRDNKAFVVCFQCLSQALNPLAEIKFELNSENHNCMKKIISESLATFRMNENELLEVTDNPAIGGQQMIILHLECLLINLLRLLASKEKSDIVFLDEDNFNKNLINEIILYLKRKVSEKLSLDEICGRFSYSKSFLCKTFKLQTGDTIIAYFNKLKIDEAKKRLTETNQNITAIAYSLGFQEVKYFDYTFKKYTGVSPASYRKGVKNI